MEKCSLIIDVWQGSNYTCFFFFLYEWTFKLILRAEAILYRGNFVSSTIHPKKSMIYFTSYSEISAEK